MTRIPSLQPKLEMEIKEFVELFPEKLRAASKEVLLVGSCSRGTATYRSDIDILVVLREGPLTFSRVQEYLVKLEDDCLSKLKSKVLDFQVQFALPSVRETKEPEMRRALQDSKTLISSGEAA